MSTENLNQNTQNNDNVCNNGIRVGRNKEGVYSIEYSGRIRMMAQEDYAKMNTQIKNLVNENSGLKKKVDEKTHELNVCKKQAIEEVRKRDAAIVDLQRQVRQLAAEREQLMNRLARFEQNQHGRTAYKLTPEVRAFLGQHYQRYSTAQLHTALTKQGVDISYETVRRYISTLKGR